MYHGGICLAIRMLNTVTESHEFTEDYFATPAVSPATLNQVPCKEEGEDFANTAHDPPHAPAVRCCAGTPLLGRPRVSGLPALARQRRDQGGDDTTSL